MAENFPETGTRVVHKDDHAKSTGPVWKVTSVIPENAKPIRLDHQPYHKLNRGLQPEAREITLPEYQNDYKQL